MQTFDAYSAFPRFKSYAVSEGRIVPNAEDYLRPMSLDPTRFFTKGGNPLATHRRKLEEEPPGYRPPYLLLADLADLDEGDAFQQGALDWCNTYGPLGILPHMVRSVAIPTDDPGVSVSFVRRAGGFRKVVAFGDPGLREPSAIIDRWRGRRASMSQVTLAGDSDVFAPFLGATWCEEYGSDRTPSLLDMREESFALGYGEPLSLFRECCHLVKQALHVVKQDSDEALRSSGATALVYLLGATDIQPRLRPANGVVLSLGAVSLLGVLGYMLVTDAAGNVLHTCRNETCGRIFTGSRRALYCPPPPGREASICRNTQKQRNWRKSNPEWRTKRPKRKDGDKS